MTLANLSREIGKNLLQKGEVHYFQSPSGIERLCSSQFHFSGASSLEVVQSSLDSCKWVARMGDTEVPWRQETLALGLPN